MSEPILEMKNISKNFGSVIALKNVDLEVYPGEIRGLIGENGSGKSTISSIAAGMQKATSGRMTFKKQSWEPASMIDALQNGIGMVVQESGTISGVTVAENIFLAETERYKNRFGLINRRKMNADATEVMKKIGVNRRRWNCILVVPVRPCLIICHGKMIIVYFRFMKVSFMMECGLGEPMRTYFISIHLSNQE